MSWILLSLLAPLAWGLANITDKYILSKLIKDPWAPVIGFGFAGAAGSLLIYFLKGFSTLSGLGILVALGIGVVYFIAELCYYKATQLGEISRVISLIYIDPLFTAALAAIFLKEVFSPAKYFGVLLLVMGAFIVSYKFGQPFKLKKFVWFAIFSAFLYGVCNLLSKYLLNQGDFWTIFSYVRIGSFIAMLPVIFYKREMLLDLVTKQAGSFALIVFNSFLTLLGTFLFFSALSLGYVTLTSALSAIQPFFVFIMTVAIGFFYPHILKEEGGRGVFIQKLLAIVLIFVGIILINPK